MPDAPPWLVDWAVWKLRGSPKGGRPAGTPRAVPKTYLWFPAFCAWQLHGRHPALRPHEVPGRVPAWATGAYPAVAAALQPVPVPPPSVRPQVSLYVAGALQRELGHGFADSTLGGATEQQLAARCLSLNRPGAAVVLQATAENEPHYAPLLAALAAVGWEFHLWGVIPDARQAADTARRAGAACYRAQTEGPGETQAGFAATFHSEALPVELRTVTTGGGFWPSRDAAVAAVVAAGGDPNDARQVNNWTLKLAQDAAAEWTGYRVDFETYTNVQANLNRDVAVYECTLLGWPASKVTPVYGAYKAVSDGSDLAMYEPLGDDFGVYLADTLSTAGWNALRR